MGFQHRGGVFACFYGCFPMAFRYQKTQLYDAVVSHPGRIFRTHASAIPEIERFKPHEEQSFSLDSPVFRTGKAVPVRGPVLSLFPDPPPPFPEIPVH